MDARETVVAVVDGGVTLATLRVAEAAPGLFVVDAVARLRLAARPLGWTVVVSDVAPDVAALAAFLGLRLEPGREAECLEEPAVEEVMQPRQPPA